MEIIGKVLEFYGLVKTFLVTNGPDVLAVIGAVYIIALFIVNRTPTTADNEALDKVYKFVLSILAKLGIKK